jgi:Rrf2 family protein
MRLGNTTKYALEAMAFLIRPHAREQWAQIAVIAETCNIPRKYLEQVLLDLKNAGLVESKKGQHGGYRLSRRPDEISLGEVLAAVSGELLPLPDWMDEPNPNFPFEAGLRDVVNHARSSMRTIFNATSIEVLVCRPENWTGTN